MGLRNETPPHRPYLEPSFSGGTTQRNYRKLDIFRGPAARHEKRDLLLRCFLGSTGRNQRPGDLQQAAKDPDGPPRALVLVDSVTDDGALLEDGRLAAAPRAEDEDLIMRPRRRVRPRVRPCGGPRFRRARGRGSGEPQFESGYISTRVNYGHSWT